MKYIFVVLVIITFLSVCYAFYKEINPKKAYSVRKTKNEKANIAKRFNNIYTYKQNYNNGKNAWMCPECNRIHLSGETSFFTGLQYPSCCSTESGNRLNHGIELC